MRYILAPLCMIAAFCATPQSARAEAAVFENGQVWKCTQADRKAPPGERLQFIVTGRASKREVSRRLNFQNDDLVISVAMVDLDPKACTRVDSFLHLAFTPEGLQACAPEFIEQRDDATSSRALRDARGDWLISMQRDKNIVIDLNPSYFLARLRQMRCEATQ